MRGSAWPQAAQPGLLAPIKAQVQVEQSRNQWQISRQAPSQLVAWQEHAGEQALTEDERGQQLGARHT